MNILLVVTDQQHPALAGYTGKTAVKKPHLDRLAAGGNSHRAETGASVGIPDQFYFSKLFKQWTGESPLAYRKHTPML